MSASKILLYVVMLQTLTFLALSVPSLAHFQPWGAHDATHTIARVFALLAVLEFCRIFALPGGA
jgi:hypothetical protein